MTYSNIIMYVCFVFFIVEVFRFIFNLQWGVRKKEYDGEFIINENPEIDDIFKLELKDENIYDKEELLIKVVINKKEED